MIARWAGKEPKGNGRGALRALTRQRALTIGAAIHLIGFAVMSTGATEVDGVMIFVFGIVPAAFAVSSVVRHEATRPKLIRRDRR